MSRQTTVGLIRLGLWTLPVAGLLKLLGQFGAFNSVGFGIPDQEAPWLFHRRVR
jgi:hypothetical protein